MNKRRRPWIVYRRVLGVLEPVARCETEQGALRRASAERKSYSLCGVAAFVAHVDQISPDLARALGVRS